MSKMDFDQSPEDWIEDFDHENGMYCCRCVYCGNEFTGHKRRVVCKVCASEGPLYLASRLRFWATKNATARKVLNKAADSLREFWKENKELATKVARLQSRNDGLEDDNARIEDKVKRWRDCEGTMSRLARKQYCDEIEQLHQKIEKSQTRVEELEQGQRRVMDFVGCLGHPLHTKKAKDRSPLSIRFILDAIDKERKEAANQIEKLTLWNQEMVKISASGGKLDGYRELAQKCVDLETEIDRLKEEIDELHMDMAGPSR